jgi:hypothetical protein
MPFSRWRIRSHDGGQNIFQDTMSVTSFFLYVLTRAPLATGFNYADGVGDKSSFITSELHQLAVYGEH